MKRYIFLCFAVIFSVCIGVGAQMPLNTLVQITKAEDARAYDERIEGLLKSREAAIRERAALAAGRIGDKRAVTALTAMLMDSANLGKVNTMVVFALGEIEAAEGGNAVLDVLKAESGFSQRDANLLSRAVEAAGKIVAANAKDESLKELKAAIVRVIEDELKTSSPKSEVLTAGATAVLRARPDGGEIAVAKMLGSDDARVRSDALNTLTRLRSKQRLSDIRGLLRRDPDAVVRANAARVLGAAEDKDALPLLIDYAVNGDDLRVRVACIRSLAGSKDAAIAEKLLERGNKLLAQRGQSRSRKPIENAELLEIVTALGRLIPGTEHVKTITFLRHLRAVDGYSSPETEIAFARVAPKIYIAEESEPIFMYAFPNAAAAYGQGMGEIAALKSNEMNAQAGQRLTQFIAGMAKGVAAKDQKKMLMAMPDLMRALAELKPDNLDEILRGQMANEDVFIRAAAAELLSERPLSKENFAAIEKAFAVSMIKDKRDNEAMLAILDALAKLDKKAATGSLLMALNSRDYLVRKKAFELLDDKELEKTSPGIPFMLKQSREKKQNQVQPYLSAFGTKLGQILNSEVDYRRALSRKNGSVKAVITTEKGSFTIVFDPEEAPLTVDNWVKLARLGYFNGLEVHRVVPNFVMQDGDPRGDGNGGPGWSIRCEVNTLGYDRGAVGMALSGKDTGGSQWFVTHSPQPHLDGGYTVFGHVDEVGMKVVDKIVRGDKIISVKIVGK